MPSVTIDQILKALGNVKDPESGDDIVSRDMISGLQTKDGHVAFAIEVDPVRGVELEPLRKEAEKTVHDLPGVISVTAVLTAEVPAGPGSGGNGGQPQGQPTRPGMPVGDGKDTPPLLPGVAAIIAVVAGMSGGLGLGSLWLFGYPFGFMAIVGTMGLIGVAINDSIVVLAALREDELARSGDPGAIRDVIVRSSRHVFATTFTTIAGFLPLIIEGGGFWPPLAITIAGGVVGATLLALVFVPSSYLLASSVRQTVEQTEQSQTEQSPIEVRGLVPEFATA